jgi:formylglycine-generating enzyme required for sulfatase activity/serine/threonine protein kinase
MSHPASDRNLLFGILALQMDFVRRDDLVAAMHAWVLDKARSLGQILREQGKLSEEEHALLEGLVHKHLERHGGDAEQSLAALGPVRHDLGQIADADVQASLAYLSTPAGPAGQATGPYVPPATLPPHDRFQILRPHAKGGLGEVYVARDEELRREVALKEIQERHAHSPESRARFLLEAEITGGLEHPGIVPVYGLGAYSDGRPFYAMRLVKGESLKDAIARFYRERESLPAGERTLRLRQLLSRFVAVCNAVAYAHSRGVLHRDLKPDNVMLGPYGETLVVDWGLAKVQGQADTNAEAPLRPGRDASAALTQAGMALGTPAYMSPEQAAGRLEQLGPASDVYSLGATLYCLLTGQVPFAEGDVGAVLGKVQRGDFASPRQVNRQVPPALEAVCLNAMALQPAARYATPRELAEEIERWLADEPVRAYREPLPARLGRWLRRHQTLTVGAGALLLTGVIALAVSTLLIGQAQQATGEALNKEQQARWERAQAQVDDLLHAAPETVPFILARLDKSREDVLPRLRQLWANLPKDGTQTARPPVSKLLLPTEIHSWHARLRVGMALLPTDAARVKNELYAEMLNIGDPREFLLVRDALGPFKEELRDSLWQQVKKWKSAEQARAGHPPYFRALVALAAFDPDNPAWQDHAEPFTEQLLTANALHLETWRPALAPIRRVLQEPLAQVCRGRKLSDHKMAAALLLALFSDDRPRWLTDMALDLESREYLVMLPQIYNHRREVLPLLQGELAKTPAETATDADKDHLAFRQANAFITLLHLEVADPGWTRLLKHTPDPSRRTFLIHHLKPYGVESHKILRQLDRETDVSVRRALLLGLGDYASEVSPSVRRDVIARLLKDYAEDPDPGIHSAIEWALRQWKEDRKLPKLKKHRPKNAAKGQPTWYVNGQGQTLTVIPGPVDLLMGSPESEPDRVPDETRHRRKIPRSFAIGTKPVTVAQFRRFLEANPAVEKLFFDKRQVGELLKKHCPDEDGPIILVSWYMAAAYCNWLSKEEGLPEQEWCYPSNLLAGMVMEAGYLKRKGYRLPTETEWEYACRAGASTSRYYGRTEGLLDKYAWLKQNSGDRAHRVGHLRPNDLGLFDLYGNVATWCQDRGGPYPEAAGQAVEDGEDPNPNDATERMYRGGTFFGYAGYARSAQRGAGRPNTRYSPVGLRVARTAE